jgi:hypothetical protein
MSRPGDGGRASQERVLERLRLASRKGDHAALALALDEMRTLAFTPRYWMKYLTLLEHPLARLVDLLVLKQGDKIARQKGWTGSGRPRKTAKTAKPAPAKPAAKPVAKPAPPAAAGPPRRRRAGGDQPSLFPGL